MVKLRSTSNFQHSFNWKDKKESLYSDQEGSIPGLWVCGQTLNQLFSKNFKKIPNDLIQMFLGTLD